MPNVTRLQVLVDLRRQRQPRLSQSAVARKFDLDPTYGRKAISAWELGENIPSAERRVRFMGYLWDDLELRKTPERFEGIWQILVEEWKWDPISEKEWREYFTGVPRLRSSQTPMFAPHLPRVQPNCLPLSQPFVGRQVELDYYEKSLEQSGVAVVCGLVGVGKTTLAAHLAQMVGAPDKIFWHVCRERDSLDTIIWKLAEFLARYNSPEVWELLQNSLTLGITQPKAEVLDCLFQQLHSQHYVLCFDDFHHVAAEALAQGLVARLQQGAANRDFKLIVTINDQIAQVDWNPTDRPLAGLTLNAFNQLLKHKGIVLSSSVGEEFHTRTAGNAALLMLVIQLLEQVPEPENLRKRLVNVVEVKQFLLNAIHRQCTADELSVMSGLAVLMSYPATAEAIKATTQVDNLALVLTRLCRHHWLREAYANTDQLQRAYVQPAIVQTFYYDLLTRRKRRELHLQAARYYQSQPEDTFLVALHCFYAQQEALAVTVISQDIRAQLVRGDGHKLQWLLRQIEIGRLSEDVKIKFYMTLGQIYRYFQQLPAALAAFETANTQLDALAHWHEARHHRIQICRELGLLLRDTEPNKALLWLQRGLDELGEDDSTPLPAELLIQIGHIHLHASEYQAARTAFESAFAKLAPAPSLLRLFATIGLGTYHLHQGDFWQSQEYFQIAAHMARILRDPVNELSMYIKLAALYQVLGKWIEAFTSYAKAEKLAERLGKGHEKLLARLNSEFLYLQNNDHQAAKRRLHTASVTNRYEQPPETMIPDFGYLKRISYAPH